MDRYRRHKVVYMASGSWVAFQMVKKKRFSRVALPSFCVVKHTNKFAEVPAQEGRGVRELSTMLNSIK